MKAFIFMAGVSALGFGFGTGALAQQAAQPAASSDATTGTSDKSAGEIVVTAQRRHENLLQTPIAAAVLSGADLAQKGVVTVDQLQFAMPSVVINNFGQGLEFNIRGIGKAEHNSQTTTGVITYRDGVPSFPGYFQEEPYFDIADIQVLRGPQGTIVGQNSTGGAVFANTNDPIVGGGYHGYLNANFGNYTDAGVQGALNVPISDTFAARVAFFGDRRDSFYTITGPGGTAYTGNPGNVREAAGRISFLWKPTSNLSILSKTDFDYLDMGAYPADPFEDRFATIPGTNTPNPNHTDLFNITANGPQQARDKFVRSILKIDYAFDSGIKLRSISGFSTGNTAYAADLDGTASGIPAQGPFVAVPANETFYDTVTETQFSQEFNVISPDNKPVTWLLGAFGLWDTYFFPAPFSNFDINANSTVTGVYAPYYNYQLYGRNPERSLAAFGQIGFSLTSTLKLDLGGRYTDSRTTNYVSVQQYGTLISDSQIASSHAFSYKVSLGWKIDPDNFLYAFAASGFKPGGLNVPVGLGNPAPFAPETVQSFEGGWKSNFGGGHGHLTIDGFYNNYKNFQVIIGYPTYPTFGDELNVANTTRIYGFEAEADYKIGGLTLDGGISVVHSALGQFYANDPRNYISGVSAVPPPCDPNVGPASATCYNLKGVQQAYSPPFTFNASAKYDLDLGQDNRLTPSVNFGHVAPQWATLFENVNLGDRLQARNILGAQLGLKHGSWTVTVYGTNLTNEHYVAALNSGLDFAGPPRQYGLKLLEVF
ncbi:TonB-dependent receptor [Novosphingobium sp. FSW06-99]|uniref:TonB-dependent receptor n=1 Tax=Novosphingobium sp. FSW06-99 TaxID=1739113 RepID=UPI00076D8CC5|nr:TonB-dependent receptor [Novosphingobium sp. FSW06-99]KUR79413.1 TonB-dependent receptor [Novosphingobium sp. FSW06-99]